MSFNSRMLYQIYVNKCKNVPTGKGFWTAHQHPHQDRGIPDTDFQVRHQTASLTSRWLYYKDIYSYILVFLMSYLLRYYSERGDAVAKASKQPHVVSLFFCVLDLDIYN